MQRMRAQQRRRREVRRVLDEHTNCGRAAREVSKKALGGGKAAYECVVFAVMNKDFTLSRYALKDGERNMSTLWACA